MNELTQHPNSILNPDVVAEWCLECTAQQCEDKARRSAALLPNVERFYRHELPRAKKAVELWHEAAAEQESFKTAVLHKDGSTSIFHFWAEEWVSVTGRMHHDAVACKVARMSISEALEFLNASKAIFFPL